MAMSLLASTNFLGCASRLSSSSASRLFSRTILYSSSIRGSTIATNQRAAKMPVVKAARTEAKQVELASRAPEFELVEPLTGKKWTLSEFQGHPALLVMFICNHCPFVVLLKAEIAKLTDEYMKRGLGAVAISSNSVKTHPQDGPEPMAKEAKQFGYQFPYLYDESQEVARAFGAVCTPEFFLYKKNKNILRRAQWTSVLVAFARNGGHLQQARRFFDEMPDKDVVAWNALLSVYAHNAPDMAEARRVFESMPLRDLVSWNTMLAAYAKTGQMEEAESLFAQMPVWNLGSWNALLSASANSARPDSACRIFNEMPVRDLASWTALLSAHARAAEPEAARRVFDAMPQRDLVASTAMVDGYARAGLLGDAKTVFNSMPVHDAVACNSAIAACDNLGYAARLFAEMPERTTATHNAMVSAYVQAGDIDRARRFFDEDLPRHSLVSWNTLLSAYVSANRLDDAEAVYCRMPAKSSVSSTTMLVAYANSGHLESARLLFDSMAERDAFCWNTMLAAYAEKGLVRETEGLFDSAPQKDVVAWTALLKAYAQGGHLAQAQTLFGRMPYRNVVAWTTLLTCYSRRGELQQAAKVFENMPERDAMAWSAMLLASALSAHFADTVTLFHEMQMVMQPISDCFLPVLTSCSHMGRVWDARCYLASMVTDFDIKVERMHWLCLVDALSRAGRMVDARELVQQMSLELGSLEVLLLRGKMEDSPVLSGHCIISQQLIQQLQVEQSASFFVAFDENENTFGCVRPGGSQLTKEYRRRPRRPSALPVEISACLTLSASLLFGACAAS